jgi:hypothetical protein
MPETVGNISVPEIAPLGTFPIVPDYPHGRAWRPDVVVHQFGSGNAKIEQRFLLGTGARRFTIRKSFLRDADRLALRDFFESKYGAYGAFTYNAPNDDGVGTTTYTCRFANEPLSWEMVADHACSVGVTLVEIPATSPTYTLNQTVTRFPTEALNTALLSQVQRIIPLIRIVPLQAGYPAIYLSDRCCTVGTQLYQARLLEFDGIQQGMGNEADEATFTFGNADRLLDGSGSTGSVQNRINRLRGAAGNPRRYFHDLAMTAIRAFALDPRGRGPTYNSRHLRLRCLNTRVAPASNHRDAAWARSARTFSAPHPNCGGKPGLPEDCGGTARHSLSASDYNSNRM